MRLLNHHHILLPPIRHFTLTVREVIIVLVVVCLTVMLAYLMQQLLPHASLALLFLTAVVLIATRTGIAASLLASLLSFLAFNFFFTRPYFTLAVADDGDITTLVFFLCMAILTGQLAAKMQQQIQRRKQSIRHLTALYEISRSLASAASTSEVLKALAQHLSNSLQRAVCIEKIDPQLDSRICATTADAASEPVKLPDTLVAQVTAAQSDSPLLVAGWSCVVLGDAQAPLAVVAVSGGLDAEQNSLLESFAQQASVAVDRTELVAELEQARVVSETEQLRSALLSSISHDLRTPLASIIGSTTSLLEYGAAFKESDRQELLTTVVEEAQRLDRYIQNLLDMTRLGQGSLTLKRDWVDVHDLVSSAVDRLRDALKAVQLKLTIDNGVPLLWIHGVLIEQALVNLLDNAIRFSPPGGEIELSAFVDQQWAVIELCDQGPGIPAEEREKIFDMFYTVQRGDRGNLQGTGLGLAICRGMVAAHQGTVTAFNGKHGLGTCFQIRLPLYPEE